MGYDFSINTCEDGSVNDNCRLSLKLIRWDYLRDLVRKRLFDVVSGLIHLKTNYKVFNTTDFMLDVGSNTVAKKIFLNSLPASIYYLQCNRKVRKKWLLLWWIEQK